MEILFMGTAAAEGAPALFCDCEACRYARKVGGKEIRTRASALIDGKLLLDFGHDNYHHVLQYGLNFSTLHAVLITHSHGDHFQPSELEYRLPVYAHVPENEPPLIVYGNEKVGAEAAPYLRENCLEFQQVKPFETRRIEGYAVTPLEAVHCLSNGEKWPVTFEGKVYYRQEEAMFYLIEKDGASILYAHDTDEFTPADMEFLAGKKIDLISLDCTNGRLDATYVGHMGAKDNLRMREKLLANGAADDHTIFVANHFSHNGLLPYAELEKLLPGFLVAYDSMRVSTETGRIDD